MVIFAAVDVFSLGAVALRCAVDCHCYGTPIALQYSMFMCVRESKPSDALVTHWSDEISFVAVRNGHLFEHTHIHTHWRHLLTKKMKEKRQVKKNKYLRDVFFSFLSEGHFWPNEISHKNLSNCYSHMQASTLHLSRRMRFHIMRRKQ